MERPAPGHLSLPSSRSILQEHGRDFFEQRIS